MPREIKHVKHPQIRKERLAYGIFISALGCLWLASEIGWLQGWLQITLPLGPIIIILIGFFMMLPWLEK